MAAVAAAPSGGGGLLQVYSIPTPGRVLAGVIVGVSQRLLPRSARKQKTKEKKNLLVTPKQKKKKTGLLQPYSSIPSGLGSTSISTSASPPNPSWGAGVSSSGVSGTSVALFSRRGRDGDLHPLAAPRASRLAAQASARAPWGPPQLAHFAAPCGHGWPFPARHPATGHR